MTSDDNYAMYMAVTITSILLNTKSFIDFYVLDGGIEEDTKKGIEKLKDKFDNFNIEFIKMEKNLVKDFPDVNHFSRNAYYRYFIPDLKPELSKVLYIDTDMVIKCDISNIYNIDIQNKPLYAVPYLSESKNTDDKWINHIKKKFKITSKYINSGLLLINCEYFRNNNILKLLVETTNEYANALECPDQDVLNMIFQEKIGYLDGRYNLIADLTHKKDPKYLKDCLCDEKGCILHFTGGGNERPWLNAKCVCGECFWEYAQYTPFLEKLKNNLAILEEKKKEIKPKLPKIKKEYQINKILSKITFGKMQKKFKETAKDLKKAIKLAE